MVGGLSSQEQLSYSRLLLKTAAKQSRVPYLAAGLNDGILVFKERIRCMRNLSAMKRCRFPAVLLCAVMLLAQLLTGSSVAAENNLQQNLTQAETETRQESPGMETAETSENRPLTSTPTANTSEPLTLYRTEGNGASYIYESGDGTWKDAAEEPIPITETASGSSDRDEKFLDGGRTSEPRRSAVASVTVYDSGQLNRQVLYQGPDGSWQNQAGGLYTANEDGSFTGPDGTLWTP